jgi:hypothetical protein
MDADVTLRADGEGWIWSLRDEHRQVRIRLVAAAGGVPRVAEVSVASDDPSGVTPASLRRAPYAQWIQRAKDAVAQQTPRHRLKRMSDILVEPFLQDRRGKAAREDRDYAQLAELYVSRGSAGKHLARDLATRHGGAVTTWRSHLTKAKRFVEVRHEVGYDDEPVAVAQLTDEALRLLYGDDYLRTFEWERDEDTAEQDLAERRRQAGAFIRRHTNPGTDWERQRAAYERMTRGSAWVELGLRAAEAVLADTRKPHESARDV